MLGAKDINLTITWRFVFSEYGKRHLAEIGTICADVGGEIDFGVIDHHLRDDSEYESSASAIARHPHFVLHHLLGAINDTYYRGLEIKNRKLTFTYITHKYPDWDGMVSYYLCRYIVQNGMLPPDGITRALCRATDVIDQGRAKIEGSLSRPFLIYNMMSHNESNWENLLLYGCRLIDDVIEHYENKKSPLSFLDPVDAIPERYRQECKQLEQDMEYFKHDIAESFDFELYIPSQDESLARVRAIAMRSAPRSKMIKYWVREDTDYKVLIVPYEREGIIDRVIISVDPQSSYRLPYLGYALERAETERRSGIGKKRYGRPRFEKEYCDNEDPWYDGRNHSFTIIDSPSQGTVLSYDEIINIIKTTYVSPDFKPLAGKKTDAFVSYRRKGGVEIAWTIKMLLEKKGKSVFLDFDDLKSGKFNLQLLESIRNTKCFILILSEGALSRCCNENDWVRQEIREALSNNIRILPLFLEGFAYKDLNNLPEEIKELANCQGITLNYEYFHATVEKISKYIEEGDR